MGKFQTFFGSQLGRTKEDVINDYANFLKDKGVISEEELPYYTTDPKGQIETLDLLFDKLYETTTHNKCQVSTIDAFYHFVRFVLNKNWNILVKNFFLDVERHRYSAILASRQTGKSYFIFVLYSLFKMFLYRGTKILIVSNIKQQCVENLRITKEVIDTNELLIEKKDINKGKDLKWTETQIEYNGGMLLTLTVGTSPRGQSVHYAFTDDVLRDDSKYADEEIENYVFGQLFPCVQRNKGRLILAGTPFHIKDIYHLVMNEKEDFGGKLITDGRVSAKGFYSKAYPIKDTDGKLLLPEIYNEEAVAHIRKTQGELKFQREYMLECTDTAAVLFPFRLTKRCVLEDYSWEYRAEHPGKTYVIGADVATAGSASADFSAFVVLEVFETDQGVKKIVRHIVHKKGMQITGEADKDKIVVDPGQVDIIQELSAKFNNALVVVEKNNVGVAIIQELRKRNVNVDEFVTDNLKKQSMIRYLISEFESKNIIIPKPTDEINRLLNELNNFGVRINKMGHERMEALSGHDDLVMAFAIANQAVQKFGGVPLVLYDDSKHSGHRPNPFSKNNSSFVFGI